MQRCCESNFLGDSRHNSASAILGLECTPASSRSRLSSAASAASARSNGWMASPCAISLARPSLTIRFRPGRASWRLAFALIPSASPRRYPHGSPNVAKATVRLCKWKSAMLEAGCKRKEAGNRKFTSYTRTRTRAFLASLLPAFRILFTSICSSTQKALDRASVRARRGFAAMRRAPRFRPRR
jgi:hypothetical protein